MISTLISSTMETSSESDALLATSHPCGGTSSKRRDPETLPFYRPDVRAFLDLRGQLALESFQSELYIFFTNGFPTEFSVIVGTIIRAHSRVRKFRGIPRGVKIIYIEMRNKFRSINQKPIKLLAYLCKNKKLSCQSREKREKVLCVK